MGRRTKQGLDYFPLDTELDEKFDVIEAKHGEAGFSIAIKLLQHVYRNGYWCLFDETKKAVFYKKYVNNLSFNVFISILNDCINADLFNRKLFDEYNILTSKGIQKTYFEIVKRRMNVEIVPEYLLIRVSDDINSQNVDRYGLNGDKNKQTETETETEMSMYQKMQEDLFGQHHVSMSVTEKVNWLFNNKFYNLYPKKQKKQVARKKYQRVICPNGKINFDLAFKIEEHIEGMKNTEGWKKENGKFVPMPSTYLNQERWEDGIPEEEIDWRDRD